MARDPRNKAALVDKADCRKVRGRICGVHSGGRSSESETQAYPSTGSIPDNHKNVGRPCGQQKHHAPARPASGRCRPCCHPLSTRRGLPGQGLGMRRQELSSWTDVSSSPSAGHGTKGGGGEDTHQSGCTMVEMTETANRQK